MGERDQSQWWDESWNVVTGCTPVGAGCDHCWARGMMRRFPALHRREEQDVARPREFTSVLCHSARLQQPLHWRKPRVVACSLLGDLFHEQVPAEFVRAVFTAANQLANQKHRFVFLTKRPARLAELFSLVGSSGEGAAFLARAIFLVSVWDQASADAVSEIIAPLPRWSRIGLHVEPMLGPISIPHEDDFMRMPDWVVVGGENGPGARPMDPEWARRLREQCRHRAPFWFKGRGSARAKLSAGVDLEMTREVPWGGQ